MTVLVDTGPLVAYLNQEDPRHPQAVELLEKRVWRGRYGVAIGIDAVLDEGATLLKKRPGRKELSQRFVEHFFPRPNEPAAVRLALSDEKTLRRAADIQLQYYDQGISFTDALLMVHAVETGGIVATFDAPLRALVTSVDGTEKL